MEGIKPNLRRRVFRPLYQNAAQGAKSAVSDCILFVVVLINTATQKMAIDQFS